MKVYLDEHIHLTMASLLRARGIDCVTTRDAGNLGCSDEAQLAFATSHGRAILTFNHKDFLALADTQSVQAVLTRVRDNIFYKQ